MTPVTRGWPTNTEENRDRQWTSLARRDTQQRTAGQNHPGVTKTNSTVQTRLLTGVTGISGEKKEKQNGKALGRPGGGGGV